MTTKPEIVKAGRGVRAKIWTNQNEKGAWKNVTITRTYKDTEGKFHESDSFSVEDLLHVAFVAFQVYSRLKVETEQ